VRTPLALLFVVPMLALPASALASVTLDSAKLTPSTTQAAAHAKVTIDLSFGVTGSDDVKSIGVVLPQGLVGDPNSADRCRPDKFAADQCADSTVVGTTTAGAVIMGTIPQDVPGTVYNLQPKGGEPARLGVVLRPSAVGLIPLAKVFLESPVTTGPETNFGLKTVFDNLPRNSGGLDIQLTSQQLVLNDKAAHGPFITNPTGCREAVTNVTITSYDEPNTPRTGTSKFTPTGCDTLPFAPTLSGNVGGSGATAAGRSPGLVAVIAPGGAGESNVASAKITLPAAVNANLDGLSRACAQDLFAAGQCPATARVGSAVAASPLLATPLTGPVTLVASVPLPSLAVQFGPPVPLTLVGASGLENSLLTNTFEGIPDVPLSRFELTIDGGGTNGLLKNIANLCKLAAAPTATGTLVGQSGKTANISAALEVRGCTPGPETVAGGGEGEPRASLSLRYRHRVGALRARFQAARGGKPLTRAQLRLPKDFLAKGAKHARRRLRVTTGKRRLGRRAVKLRGRRTLAIALGGGGAKTVTVRWGGVKPARKLARRLPKRPRLTFVARLTPKGEKMRRLKLTVRPAVAGR
jgi:hypothetical protein